jgi:hypothetical protein
MVRLTSYLYFLLILTYKIENLQRLSTQVRNGSSKTLNKWIASMGVNISKSKYFVGQIEHLEYWITRPVQGQEDCQDC